MISIALALGMECIGILVVSIGTVNKDFSSVLIGFTAYVIARIISQRR